MLSLWFMIRYIYIYKVCLIAELHMICLHITVVVSLLKATRDKVKLVQLELFIWSNLTNEEEEKGENKTKQNILKILLFLRETSK